MRNTTYPDSKNLSFEYCAVWIFVVPLQRDFLAIKKNE